MSKKKIDSIAEERHVRQSFDGLPAIRPTQQRPQENQGGSSGEKQKSPGSDKK